MSETRDLLIEIGTEELPPKALKGLSAAFTRGISRGLDDASLNYSDIISYATPRRMAVLVKALVTSQPDKSVERRGPALKAAFDNEGTATRAASGFAKSCGVTVEDLSKLETKKGSWLTYTQQVAGSKTAILLPAIVQTTLDKLPIPKRMRWGALDSLFVRPVHWVVLVFGDEVLPAEILSVSTGNQTRGHRYHKPAAITINTPDEYESQLQSEGMVIAGFEKRQQLIREQIIATADKINATAEIDPDLLDEVTSMVEWPHAIIGEFDKHFLEVPAEALISAMKKHQKYFHLVDDNNQLLPYFITISNIDSSDPAQVKEGNERVIRPRLADANFFWTQDKKQPLQQYLDRLKTVVFQNKLGTLYDKTQRVSILAGTIAEMLQSDSKAAIRAAQLSKCDLMSEMVNEFPDLQGIMGRYYALHDNEKPAVAQALDEQYMPRFAGDQTPASTTGQTLAIADRLDTLIGIFAIGQIPSGDKDPFALRRAALGLLRTIIEHQLPLDIKILLQQSAEQYPPELNAANACDPVYQFMLDRLKGYFTEQSVSPDVFDAVMALRPSRPYDFANRVAAVAQFKTLEAAKSLAAANKRISNILKKIEGELPDSIDQSLLTEPAEINLANKLTQLTVTVIPLLDNSRYTEALTQLAALRQEVDVFFDDVMVMVEDEAVKNNRIALLSNLHNLFLQVADLSLLQ